MLLLTNNENTVVKCYAFDALLQRENIDILSIVLKHVNDTSSVHTMMGDVGITWQTGRYFFLKVDPRYNESKMYTLTQSQVATVDSILIFDKTIKIGLKTELLYQLKPDAKYYKRVREIGKLEHNLAAVCALARYMNRNDIPLIK